MERLYYRSGRHKKGERRVYYYTCQTFTKRSKSLCARNMVSEKELREAALSTIQAQIRIAADLKRIVTEVWDSGETKDQSRIWMPRSGPFDKSSPAAAP